MTVIGLLKTETFSFSRKSVQVAFIAMTVIGLLKTETFCFSSNEILIIRTGLVAFIAMTVIGLLKTFLHLL